MALARGPVGELERPDLLFAEARRIGRGAGMDLEPVRGVRGASLVADDPVRGEWDLVVLSLHFVATLLAATSATSASTASGPSSSP